MTRTRYERAARQRGAIEPPSDAAVVASVVLVTGLVVAIGALTGSLVLLLGLLVFLPGTAATLCSVRQTAAVAAWSTLVVSGALLERYEDGQSWFDTILMVLLTAALSAAPVYACDRRIRHEYELVRLRTTAAVMQRHILHPLPLLTADVLVDGVYEPLQEDRLVGGDVYDVVETPWGPEC
ncbi:hypothetical protein GCM10027091_18160 [Streptomyces daliensis]